MNLEVSIAVKDKMQLKTANDLGRKVPLLTKSGTDPRGMMIKKIRRNDNTSSEVKLTYFPNKRLSTSRKILNTMLKPNPYKDPRTIDSGLGNISNRRRRAKKVESCQAVRSTKGHFILSKTFKTFPLDLIN